MTNTRRARAAAVGIALALAYAMTRWPRATMAAAVAAWILGPNQPELADVEDQDDAA